MKALEKAKGILLFYIVILLTAYGLVVRSNQVAELDNVDPSDERIVVNNN